MGTKDEYLMLRDEILHLDSMINNTINFFYVFMASYLAFAFDKGDTILFLVSYVVIMPAYFMVLSKMEGLCRIGAYLKVFGEKNEYKWETRNYQFREHRVIKIFNHMLATNLPFLLGSSSVLMLHIYKYLQLDEQTKDEKVKLCISVALFAIMSLMIFRYRKISTGDYIEKWEKYKE